MAPAQDREATLALTCLGTWDNLRVAPVSPYYCLRRPGKPKRGAGTPSPRSRAGCGWIRSFETPKELTSRGHGHGESCHTSLKGLSPCLRVFTRSRVEQEGQPVGLLGLGAPAIRAEVNNVDCGGPRSQPAAHTGAPCPAPGSGGRKAGGYLHVGLHGLSGNSGT